MAPEQHTCKAENLSTVRQTINRHNPEFQSGLIYPVGGDLKWIMRSHFMDLICFSVVSLVQCFIVCDYEGGQIFAVRSCIA